ncbi:hypothetical protein PQQ77_31510, partial [Paraburkholderia strydomiana]|uniref:hypothetical protein n=1 Tax=Paraburkholderia strydomiana TaxID=1245417 RepID=UPI0038B82D73
LDWHQDFHAHAPKLRIRQPNEHYSDCLTAALSRVFQHEDIAPQWRDGNIERSFYFNRKKTRAATPGSHLRL